LNRNNAQFLHFVQVFIRQTRANKQKFTTKRASAQLRRRYSPFGTSCNRDEQTEKKEASNDVLNLHLNQPRCHLQQFHTKRCAELRAAFGCSLCKAEGASGNTYDYMNNLKNGGKVNKR
jgi:hypothetical protein